MTQEKFNDLVDQCMNSGFFKSRDKAENYVLEYCMPKPEPKFEIGKEVFTEDEKPVYTFDNLNLGGFKPRG